VLLLLAPIAHAAAPDNAAQLAGLFMQSCVPFAGDHTGLRNWARQLNLAEVPEPARAAFLHGAAGVVFDASNATGKFVVVSEDAGGCSALADTANGAEVVKALEDNLRQSGIAFTPGPDTSDPQEARLRHREYTASLGARKWRIVTGTVRDRQGGRAMLTANPD